MKFKFIIIISFILTSVSSISQIKVIYPNETTDLSSTTVTQNLDISTEKINVDLWIINNSPDPKKLVCKRTEEYAVTGTENQTCWVICPPTKNKAGEGFNPFFVSAGMDMTVENLAVGDTSKSFSFKYFLNGADGCSSYKFQWYNEDDLNTVLATIDIDIIHSSTGNCIVGVNENKKSTVVFSPNPTSGKVNFTFDNSEVHNVKVVGLLGKVVINEALTTGQSIDLLNQKKGVYFVIVSDLKGQKITTQKLILE